MVLSYIIYIQFHYAHERETKSHFTIHENNPPLTQMYKTPQKPAKLHKIEKNAQKLGLPNPFEQAADVLAEIKEQLIEIPLTEEGIPEIINPFANLPEPDLGPVSQLPPVVTGANPTVMNANQRLIPGDFNSLTQAQKYEILFGNN